MKLKNIISKLEKFGFSYIELIITMALVVVVIMMTSPFLSGMSKREDVHKGEYKCYARYVESNNPNKRGWKLFENTKINSKNYSGDDSEARDNICEFYRPNGNITSFRITLIGGGGSGSMSYLDENSNESQYIYAIPGQPGKPGQSTVILDSLENLFDSEGTLKIRLCDDMDNSDIRICIGKGGNLNQEYGTSYKRVEKLWEIADKLSNGAKLTERQRQDLIHLKNQGILDALEAFESNSNTHTRNDLINEIRGYETPDDVKGSTGRRGGYTKMLLSKQGVTEEKTVQGGDYGETSDTYIPYDYNSLSRTTYNGKIFYYTQLGMDKKPDFNIRAGNIIYKNCDANDANTLSDQETNYPENKFGQGGEAGGFICMFNQEPINTSHIGLNSNSDGDKNSNIADNKKCYFGKSGRGAGGAIIIKWE